MVRTEHGFTTGASLLRACRQSLEHQNPSWTHISGVPECRDGDFLAVVLRVVELERKVGSHLSHPCVQRGFNVLTDGRISESGSRFCW